MNIRVAVVLPGLGRVWRGAETAFIDIARRLDMTPDIQVTAFGSGKTGPRGLVFRHIPCQPRERFSLWPKIPFFRNECYYEEFSFARSLRRRFNPGEFDVTVGCTYPYVNWFLQKASRRRGPKHVFVTENGDWMCRRTNAEYRYFDCDRLVCINPEYYRRHQERYNAVLIPNGVDAERFHPRGCASAETERSGVFDAIPRDRRIVLMVDALIASKKVAEGIEAVARTEDAFLVIAGEGPMRRKLETLATARLPRRHLFLGSVSAEKMPALFRRADVFLHTSRAEPFGMVCLEAAATGLPVVASDWEVPRWILGETALFCDPDDAESVARALSVALEPEIASRLGRDARARVLDGWTWDIQAEKYASLIREVASERKLEAAAASEQEAEHDLDRDRQLQHQ